MAEAQSGTTTCESTSKEANDGTKEDESGRYARIEECRELVVGRYRDITAPETVEGVLQKLREVFDEGRDCGCSRCALRSAMAADTFVVVEEMLKMVPADSERGVASLVYRTYKSWCGYAAALEEEVAKEGISELGKKLSKAFSEGEVGFGVMIGTPFPTRESEEESSSEEGADSEEKA